MKHPRQHLCRIGMVIREERVVQIPQPAIPHSLLEQPRPHPATAMGLFHAPRTDNPCPPRRALPPRRPRLQRPCPCPRPRHQSDADASAIRSTTRARHSGSRRRLRLRDPQHKHANNLARAPRHENLVAALRGAIHGIRGEPGPAAHVLGDGGVAADHGADGEQGEEAAKRPECEREDKIAGRPGVEELGDGEEEHGGGSEDGGVREDAFCGQLALFGDGVGDEAEGGEDFGFGCCGGGYQGELRCGGRGVGG